MGQAEERPLLPHEGHAHAHTLIRPHTHTQAYKDVNISKRSSLADSVLCVSKTSFTQALKYSFVIYSVIPEPQPFKVAGIRL